MQADITYLLIDIGAFIVPLLFSFHPKIQFYRHWRFFWPANLLVAVVFILWDALYTRIGVWGFNDRYILGPRFFGLPVEEILFFIFIPYASVFTYHCFKLFYPRVLFKSERTVSLVFVSVSALAGIFFVEKLYTGVTCSVLALLIVYLSAIRKVSWLNNFYFMYVVILVPFFIVNGLLTGTGLNEAVVWYNNQENVDLRILTIPVEDVFYGMLLLLLNVSLFEYFSRQHATKESAYNSI